MTLQQFVEKYLMPRSEEVGDCWEWKLGVNPSGTPVMRWSEQTQSVRRVIAILDGRRMADRVATFRCGNALCVNPEHVILMTKPALQLRTNSERQQWMHPARRKKISEARRRHSKLDNEKVQSIRDDPRPQRVIAAEYGISQHTVSCIKRGVTWRDYSNPFVGLL